MTSPAHPARSTRRNALVVSSLALSLVLLVGGAIAVRPLQIASASVDDARDLTALMDGIDYRLAPLRQPDGRVPRLVLERLPAGMDALDPGSDRKRTFLRALLPLVLAANEDVLHERRFLLDVRDDLAGDGNVSQDVRRRVLDLLVRYRTTIAADATLAEAVDALLFHVDAVPPSLALAQAAVESGWGTSRFALDGNALFGQSSWDESGMAPQGHEVPPYRVAAFASLQECVEAYVANLNSHPAYAAFRAMRAQERAAGGHPDGRALAATLTAYAETGAVYTATLRAVIDSNTLALFDGAMLDDDNGTLVVVAAR